MSYRGSPTNRTLKNLLPFTRWGVVFLLLAAAIVIIGALRMELAAILWGSAFVLLALYSLLANHLMRAVLQRHFDRTPDPVDFTLSADGIFP